jgi:hypothetical protein
VLTHPVALKGCRHRYCRLCILETILTGLQTNRYTPACPLCRSSIHFLSDLQKERELAETIYGLFPDEVMLKVTTTHTLERQKQVAAAIKELAEQILAEQAAATAAHRARRPHQHLAHGHGHGHGHGGAATTATGTSSASSALTSSSSSSTSVLSGGRLLLRGGSLSSGAALVSSSGRVMSLLPEGLGLGRGHEEGEAEDDEFVLLVVEMLCLAYSFVLFSFLLWLRVSSHFV